MLAGVRSKLREPYPSDFSPASVLKYSLISAIFVYVFMKAFEPFGLSQLRPGVRELLFLGYGLITGLMVFAGNLLLPRLFGRWFRDDAWNTGKHISWSIAITLSVGLACFVFTQRVYAAAGVQVRFIHFLMVMSGAFLIGGLLITGITMVNLNILLRRNSELVTEANSRISAQPSAPRPPDAASSLLTLIADNGKDRFEAGLSEMLFLASEENYVAVHVQRGKLVRVLLRGSLGRMERQLQGRFPQMYRCHRAYMVNLAKIQKVSGNAQGLRLTLPDVATSIPVSRRYVSEFRRRFGLDRPSP